MSDIEEEEVYGFYGKPLEQYDEDEIPKKRPITVEEQIATDAQGRRRFHGAFTGGFSAGFFNTVGSLEGWKPSEFKSSRSEKAERKSQKPEDYMDDEDVGEFGIAPQTVRATKDYNTSKKRKKVAFSEGPIPGEPVLHSLIASGNDTIGYLLLRNMGYKQTEKEKDEETAPAARVYGCVMPKTYEIKRSLENYQYEVPEIYKSALANPKSNSFGLSYVGLDKGNINLFKPQNLVVQDRNSKKMSISGQAFGIGAFEEEDEDIYVREDLSNYDFEITKEKEKVAVAKPKNLVFDLFVPSMSSLEITESFPPPSIPHSFSGKHKVRKSRFEPVVDNTPPVKRHEIDASVRARYLGEPEVVRKPPVPEKSTQIKDEDTPSSSNSSSNSQAKSERVGGFKFKEETGVAGLILDRFVSASKPEVLDQMEPEENSHGTKDMRDAAKSKMFGMLTRVSISWLPNSLLCKRFNIPEPNFCESELKPRQRKPINLIFQAEKNIDDSPLNKVGLQMQTKPITIEDDPINTTELPNQIELQENLPSTSENNTVAPTDTTPVIDPPKQLLKDLTEKLDVSKNIDLFKAVFMDSDSESEHEEEANTKNDTNNKDDKEEKERQETFKEQVLAVDPVLPKIKPMREGILSNVSFIKFSKPVSSKDVTPPQEECEPKEDVNLYGPMLPDKKVATPSVISIEDMSADEMWIEKGEDTKRKEHKHKKKSKKEKHKKKHKHKK